MSSGGGVRDKVRERWAETDRHRSEFTNINNGDNNYYYQNTRVVVDVAAAVAVIRGGNKLTPNTVTGVCRA